VRSRGFPKYFSKFLLKYQLVLLYHLQVLLVQDALFNNSKEFLWGDEPNFSVMTDLQFEVVQTYLPRFQDLLVQFQVRVLLLQLPRQV
jgi:hypothetical protein